MTRDIDWGIPVPLDGWRDQPTKRLYVWFDAVIGYLSASIEWARRTGDPDAWRTWWNDPEALSYYFKIGRASCRERERIRAPGGSGETKRRKHRATNAG